MLSDSEKKLLRNKISGWARQSRFRATKNGCRVDLKMKPIVELYVNGEYKCAYCGNDAGSPDHPFPIGDGAPCVLANTLPCCDDCRHKKNNHNLLWFYKNNYITKEHLMGLMEQIKQREGYEHLKEYIKTLAPQA